jgi:hypothetical protein
MRYAMDVKHLYWAHCKNNWEKDSEKQEGRSASEVAIKKETCDKEEDGIGNTTIDARLC